MARGAYGLMMLVDTTVWIDFFRGHSASWTDALEQAIASGEDVCICGMILTEVLQGVRHERPYREIRAHFDQLIYLQDSRDVFIAAADIYRSLRARGITIRKPLDCMIAAVALNHDVPLLHNDRDFEPISEYFGLKVAG